MMKFKVDENLPVQVVVLLQQAGHDALTVLDQQLKGTADRLLADICQSEGRTIITLDLDFADIRAYPPQNYAGIIVIRAKQQDRQSIMGIFEQLIKILPSYELNKALWIVDENRVRIRE